MILTRDEWINQMNYKMVRGRSKRQSIKTKDWLRWMTYGKGLTYEEWEFYRRIRQIIWDVIDELRGCISVDSVCTGYELINALPPARN